MTSITFHGGVNEVGGNKILLEDKGTKIKILGKDFLAEKCMNNTLNLAY